MTKIEELVNYIDRSIVDGGHGLPIEVLDALPELKAVVEREKGPSAFPIKNADRAESSLPYLTDKDTLTSDCWEWLKNGKWDQDTAAMYLKNLCIHAAEFSRELNHARNELAIHKRALDMCVTPGRAQYYLLQARQEASHP